MYQHSSPKLLYKYMSVDRFRQILLSNSVWFSNPSNQNDPMEFGSLDNDFLSSLLKYAEFKKVDLSDVDCDNAASVINRIEEIGCGDGLFQISDSFWQRASNRGDKFLMMSLSESFSSATMWGHYAGSGAGICIGLRSDSTFLTKSDKTELAYEFHGVRKVRYCRKRSISRNTLHSQVHALLTKNIEWKYEKEWRAIVISSNSERVEGFPFPLRKEELSEVIIGSRMPIHDARAIRFFLSEHFPNCKIFVARPGLISYEFEKYAVKDDIQLMIQLIYPLALKKYPSAP